MRVGWRKDGREEEGEEVRRRCWISGQNSGREGREEEGRAKSSV